MEWVISLMILLALIGAGWLVMIYFIAAYEIERETKRKEREDGSDKEHT
jgi:phage shock protein PspC (stress-responsive transcriptional regulator)